MSALEWARAQPITQHCVLLLLFVKSLLLPNKRCCCVHAINSTVLYLSASFYCDFGERLPFERQEHGYSLFVHVHVHVFECVCVCFSRASHSTIVEHSASSSAAYASGSFVRLCLCTAVLLIHTLSMYLFFPWHIHSYMCALCLLFNTLLVLFGFWCVYRARSKANLQQ